MSFKSYRDIKIFWPKSYVLRHVDIDSFIEEQESYGFLAEHNSERIPLKDIVNNWAINPFRDKGWLVRLQSLQIVDPYIIKYQDEKEEPSSRYEAIEKAIKYMLSWAEWHIEENKKSYASWFDMAVAFRALKISFVLRECLVLNDSLFSKQGFSLLFEALHQHVLFLKEDKNISSGNHGIFQMHALKVSSHVLNVYADKNGSADTQKSSDFADHKLLELVKGQYNEEGVHLEHSPQYHFWMLSVLQEVFESGWHYSEYWNLVKNKIEESGWWFLRPDGRLIPFGDTKSVGKRKVRRGSPDDFDFSTTFGENVYFVRHFTAGYSIIRSSENEKIPVMLAFNCVYHSHSHKHSDDMSFELYVGEAVLTDSGTNGYKINDDRKFCLSSYAHNCLVIDGASSSRKAEHAFGSCLSFSAVYGDVFVTEGMVERGGVFHKRRLYFNPEKYLLIEDSLTSGDIHRYEQVLNFSPNFFFHNNDGEKVELISEKQEIKIFSNFNFYRYCGFEDKGEMRGWTFENAKKQSRQSIITSCNDDNVIVKTAITWGGEDGAKVITNINDSWLSNQKKIWSSV